jgi:hypothetical protein
VTLSEDVNIVNTVKTNLVFPLTGDRGDREREDGEHEQRDRRNLQEALGFAHSYHQ